MAGAAMPMAAMKMCAQRSSRVWMRRQSQLAHWGEVSERAFKEGR